MADEDLNPKMRYNSLWWKGWQYEDSGAGSGGPNVQNDLDMKGNAIVNLKNPVADQDAATKKYVDDKGKTYVTKTGGVLTGDLNAGGNAVVNAKYPAADDDVATKKYVDDAIAASGGGGGGQPLQASNIRLTPTGQIAAQNVQEAMVELSREAAFTDASVVFQQSVTFNVAPQLAATATAPTADLDITTVKKVKELIATTKAAQVSLNQTPPLNNVAATNIQDAIQEIDDLFDGILGDLDASTSLAGVYDANLNQVTQAFGGGLTQNQALPPAAASNKGVYVYVKVAGSAPAPVGNVSVGDLIISTGAAWSRVPISLVISASNVSVTAVPGANGANVQDVLADLANKVSNVTANDVSITAIPGVAGANVQEALTSLANKPINVTADNVSVTQIAGAVGQTVQEVLADLAARPNISTASGISVNPAITDLPGANVQAVLTNASTKIKANTAAHTALTTRLDNLKATGVAIDAIQGVTGGNVQEALNNLASRPTTATASGVTVAPAIPDLPGANVQAVLTDASTKIKANTTAHTALTTRLDNLNATQVSFDNTTAAIPGNNVDTVQKAVEGVITKISSPNAVNASNVQFASGSGIAGDNVAAALDELKTDVTGLDATFVKKDGGSLISELNANGQKITGLADPVNINDAANKKFTEATYVKRDGGQLLKNLDANNQTIINLKPGANDGDAVNVKQLADTFQAIKSQLIGKLTYIGTYNANTNKIASVNQAIAGVFTEYTVGGNLPVSIKSRENHFLIVVEAGQGSGEAPAAQLDVGDIVYCSGAPAPAKWERIPLGATTTAQNVSVNQIAALPNATNVQQALEALANTPPGTPTAAQVTFNPPAGGSITAQNVQDAITQTSDQSVKLTGNQTVAGTKTFTAPEFDRDKSGIGFTVKANYTQSNYVRWYDTNRRQVLAYIGYGTSRNRAQFQFVNDLGFVGGHEAVFTFNRVARYDVGNTPPNLTNEGDFAHKKYVDDAVANVTVTTAPLIETIQDVDVTAASASLAGKGTMTFSYMLTRIPANKNVVSALFGMKLTLTAPWNPGDSTTPVELPGCEIAGEEYFKGLPVPVDATLQGGSFKTVAQIRLMRVVPTGGINLPQEDSPLIIGRIVCAIDGGNTKLYAVFKHNSDIAVPTGAGAFFTVRYEGLPTMVI